MIGLGITGAGVALDAATRGLDVVAVDAEDVAFGTSRWSSKLVHGGLRYLAKGQLDVAHESAVERGILMQTTAPHLVRALPMLMPLTPTVGRAQATLARGGIRAGDLLRLAARTRRETLPRPRRIGVTETLTLAPVVRREGLRGAILSWDGQLEDDVRLVLAVARTAAANGARVHTRVKVSDALGDSAMLTDSRTGESRTIRARTVINAAGVWAGQLVPEIRLRPSRGTHIVLRKETLPGVRCAVMAPVPGASNRFVFALPQPDQTFYVGLTDEEVDGEIPDVPEAAGGGHRLPAARAQRRAAEGRTPRGRRRRVRRTATPARHRNHHRRPVPQARRAGLQQRRGDRRRRQADHLSPDGPGRRRPGGRRCAASRPVPASRRSLPLLGAAPRDELAGLPDDARLVRRFGNEAAAVLAEAVAVTGLPEDELLAPISPDASRRRWPSWSSGSPTRAHAPWRTCWTGVRASGWSRRTASWPGRLPSVRWRSSRRRPGP